MHRLVLCLLVLLTFSVLLVVLLHAMVFSQLAHVDSALVAEAFLGVLLPTVVAVVHSIFRSHFTLHQLGRELAWLAIPIVFSFVGALLATQMLPFCLLYGLFPPPFRTTAVMILWLIPLVGMLLCEGACRWIRLRYPTLVPLSFGPLASLLIFIGGLTIYGSALIQVLTRVYIYL